MRAQHLFRMIAAVSAMVGSLAVADGAHAAFSVVVDCHGNNGKPDWAGTNDNVEVYAKINGYWEKIYDGDAAPCHYENSLTINSSAFNATDVKGLSFAIYNTDRWFIDKWEVRTSANGAVSWSRGIDNNVGYCVSEDPNDGNTSFCQDNIAKDFYTFCRTGGDSSCGSPNP